MTDLGLGIVFALCAIWILLHMEHGIQRLVRLRWNRWLRQRVRDRAANGFRIRRSNWFRDGGVL